MFIAIIKASKKFFSIKLRYKCFACILLISIMFTGCSSVSNYSPYTAKRYNDLKDTVTMTVGEGIGFKVRIGPLHGGLLYNKDYIGLRGGNFFTNGYDSPPMDAEILAWNAEYFNKGFFRNKNYRFKPFDIRLMEHGNIANISGPVPFVNLAKVPFYYYTQCEIVIGIFGSLRIGINPGEILDWILGIFGVDLFSDDFLSNIEYINCKNITTAGFKQNILQNKSQNKSQNKYDYAHLSAMHIAIKKDRVDLAKILLQEGAGAEITYQASGEMIKLMLDNGLKLNTAYNKSIFFRTVKHGRADAVKILLKNGIDANEKDKNEYYALWYAITEQKADKRKEVIKQLLYYGGNPNIKLKYDDYKTILGAAIWNNCTPATIDLLIAAGADPNTEDTLLVALSANSAYLGRRNYVPIIEVLIRNGAKIKAVHLKKASKIKYNKAQIIALLEQKK